MPTPPRRVSKVSETGLPQPSAACGEAAGLLAEVDALLQRRHAELAQQVEQNLEDLYVRLCKQYAFPAFGNCKLLKDGSRLSTSKAVDPSRRYVRSFTESMLMKKDEAELVSQKVTERQDAVQKLSAAEIERAMNSKPRKRSKLPVKATLKSFVHSSLFESISTFFIVTNAIFFGIETEFRANNLQPALFEGVTMVFTVVFLVELVIRIAADARNFFCSEQRMWNFADALVVAVSLVELFFQVSNLNSSINLSHIRIIRTARTVRIFRVIRILKAFSSLRILLHCVLNTLRSLIWTIFLLTMVLYIFGILFTQAAVDFLAENPDVLSKEDEANLNAYYTSLPISMYTLFKAVTGGVSWQDVARPLGAVHPCWESLFVCFISFTYFAVLNVVTGVFCQSAIESAAHDKDMVVQAQINNKQLYTQQLLDLFANIDRKNTGSMDFAMLEQCLMDPHSQAYFNALGITASDAWNLFQLLDSDGSKELDPEEFVEGCLRLRGSARSIDCHMLLYESRWTMNKVTMMCNALNEITGQLASLVPGFNHRPFDRLKAKARWEEWPSSSSPPRLSGASWASAEGFFTDSALLQQPLFEH